MRTLMFVVVVGLLTVGCGDQAVVTAPTPTVPVEHVMVPYDGPGIGPLRATCGRPLCPLTSERSE